MKKKEEGEKFVHHMWQEFAGSVISGEVQECDTQPFCKIRGIGSVFLASRWAVQIWLENKAYGQDWKRRQLL